MRILIAGGFGFIGGRLSLHLARSGHQIVLGSRVAKCKPTWLPEAEVVKMDWYDNDALKKNCLGVDVVIQAAGMNAHECTVNPAAALGFNGVATAQLVDAAIRAGVKRVIYLSTAHVYASPLVGNITEETCPRNLHPYATSHLAGEQVVLSACQSGSIEGLVLRLSNAFGAPVHRDVNCWMLLANDLCKQAIQTRKLVLQSSGMQQRDFITITQVCCVIEHILSRDINALRYGVFNLGSGKSLSVFELAQLVQRRCKYIFGYEPDFLKEKPSANESYNQLEYQSTRISEMGLNMNFDNNVEIDSLLKFCHESFNQNWSGAV